MQDGILLYEQRLGNKGSKGEVNPIHINARSKRQIRYLPDGHFKTKLGKIRIYEVLDDELKKENLIIADIILAYLTENVSLIQFIVPTPSAEHKVKELAVTIYDRLVQMGISQKLREVRTMYVSRDEATSKEAVAAKLSLVKPKDTVSRVRKALDLFQKGAYPRTLKIDDVVHLANTRIGEEVSRPFNPMSYEEVRNALQQIEKTGHDIQIDAKNKKILFTRYPK